MRIPCVLLILLLVAPALAAPEGDLADRLPANTFLYAQIPSLEKGWAGFQTLPLYNVLQDEEVQDFLESSSEALDRFLKDAGGDRNLLASILSLPATVPGEMSLAILHPEKGGWALSLVAKDEATAAALVKDLVRPLAVSCSFGSPTSSKIGEVDVLTHHGPTRDIQVAVVGRRIYAVSGEGLLARLLGPAPERSLSKTAGYGLVREKVAADGADLFAYLDLSVLEVDSGDRQARRVAGIDNLRYVGASLRMAEGRAKETVWLGFPGGRRGFFAVFPGSRVDLDAARLAPQNSFAFGAGSVKPADLYRVLVDLAAADAGGPFDALKNFEDELQKELGTRALADIVGFLGTEVIGYVAIPQSGSPIPEFMFAVEVLEPDRLQMTLDALVRTGTGAPPKSLTYRGRQIRYIPETENIGFFLPVMPCWCVTDGYLLVSYHPTILKGAIGRLEGNRKTLLDDEAFMKARKGLSGESVAAGYLNTERVFRYLYGLLVTFMTAAADEMPFDPGALPTAEAIAQHLSFALSAVTAEKEGLSIRTESDGYGTTSMTLYGFLVATMFLSPSDVREEALRDDDGCGYHLERFHAWIEEFRTTQGRWPEKLALVDPRAGWGRWYCRCPKAERARGNDPDKRDEENWKGDDFVYRIETWSLLTDVKLPDDAMLLWDSEPRHAGGRIILLVDGTVTWLPEEQFQKRLTEER